MYLQLSILPTFAITVLQKAIEWISNPVFSVRYFAFFPASSTFCLNLMIPNRTPGGLFSGGLVHGRSFPFQKLVSKRPGAYTRWGLLSEFYGIFIFFFTSLLSASRNVCGESITDKAWLEGPRLLSHLYIWGVMINIVSQLNIFLYV